MAEKSMDNLDLQWQITKTVVCARCLRQKTKLDVFTSCRVSRICQMCWKCRIYHARSSIFVSYSELTVGYDVVIICW